MVINLSERKTPQRKCVGCGMMKSKNELVRIVKSVDEGYDLDPSGKLPGRGAYVCALPECVSKALKHRGFERSFKSVFPKDLYAILSQEVDHGGAQQARCLDS